jgi:hypothetical protein
MTDRSIHVSDGGCAAAHSLEDFNTTWLHAQNRSTTYHRSLGHNAPSTGVPLVAAPNTQPTRSHMAQFIESLCSSIPPSVLSAQTLSEARFAYTINECK